MVVRVLGPASALLVVLRVLEPAGAILVLRVLEPSSAFLVLRMSEKGCLLGLGTLEAEVPSGTTGRGTGRLLEAVGLDGGSIAPRWTVCPCSALDVPSSSVCVKEEGLSTDCSVCVGVLR